MLAILWDDEGRLAYHCRKCCNLRVRLFHSIFKNQVQVIVQPIHEL